MNTEKLDALMEGEPSRGKLTPHAVSTWLQEIDARKKAEST